MDSLGIPSAWRRAGLAVLLGGPPLGAACAAPRPDRTAPLPTATINDNRAPAGRLDRDTLSVALVATMTHWHPEADDGPFIPTAAFAVAGGPPSVPGPLLRVPAGTIVRASIRNALADTLLVIGLDGPASGGRDTLLVPPDQEGTLTARAGVPGTYVYHGHTRRGAELHRLGPGGQLLGAFVVDGPAPAGDRILVINGWNGPPTAGTAEPYVMAINGRSWPFTERLHVGIGDTLRLRLINGTVAEHPMHLHGFYYRIDALGTWHADHSLADDERTLAVTHTLREHETMALTWVAERAGNWLLHCHTTFHIAGTQHQDLAREPRDTMPPHAADPDHLVRGMAGLVLGLVVAGRDAPPDGSGARRYRLVVREQPRFFPDGSAANFYSTGDVGPVEVPGRPLELFRGEKAAVTVVNRLATPTSVHWHGQELASYYDGVPGWSGAGARLAPMIAPGDSFTAVLIPPRAGTFIYHTHVDDTRQLDAGLVGPLLVLEPGTARDTTRDHVWLFHVTGTSDSAPVALNGGQSLVRLRADVTHRIRIVVITAGDEMDLDLTRDGQPVTWRPLAKDGADLPERRRRPTPARFHAGAGETLDFEWTPAPGRYRLRLDTTFNDFDVTVDARETATPP